MISKKELAEKYKHFSDNKIIELHTNRSKLTVLAKEVLQNEIAYRKLIVTPLSTTTDEIIEIGATSKLQNTTKKSFYISNTKMKRTAYIYFAFAVLTAVTSFINFDTTQVLFFIITLILGVYFYFKNDNFLQLEIDKNEIYFVRRRNYYGKIKYKDFHNLYINNKFETLDVKEVKEVEKIESFIEENSIKLILKNGDEFDILLNATSEELDIIYHEIRKAIMIKGNL